jgi:hypothetical protein
LPRSWSSSGFSSCTSRVTSCASASCCMQRLAHNRGTGAPRQLVHRQRVHYHARVHHLPRRTWFWSMRTPGMYRSSRTACLRW